MADVDDPKILTRLDKWVFHYNLISGNGRLNVKPPRDRVSERISKPLFTDEVEAMFDPFKECIKGINY